MYEKLNITENGLKILSLFTNDFTNSYYIREITKILNISPRTSQLILEDLENKGILESKINGKIKSYKINLSYSTKRYFIFIEQYKLISFLQNKLLVKEIIDKIQDLIKGIGVIFGSYAKNIEKKDSDLDIFVVGKCDLDEIDKISNLYGIDISVKVYPLSLFKKNLNKDIFLKEILKNHIIFNNAELFINLVLKNE